MITVTTYGEQHTISDDDEAELREFARDNGRRWKAVLCEMWSLGQDWNMPWARRIRNTVGPSGLRKVRL